MVSRCRPARFRLRLQRSGRVGRDATIRWGHSLACSKKNYEYVRFESFLGNACYGCAMVAESTATLEGMLNELDRLLTMNPIPEARLAELIAASRVLTDLLRESRAAAIHGTFAKGQANQG